MNWHHLIAGFFSPLPDSGDVEETTAPLGSPTSSTMAIVTSSPALRSAESKADVCGFLTPCH